MTVRAILLLLSALLLGAPGAWAQNDALPLETLRLPDGFSVSVYARAEAARSLARGDAGTVFVSTRDAGVVYALTDADGDGAAETVRRLLTNMYVPNGIDFYDGALYVATMTMIIRLDDIENRLDNPPVPTIVYSGLPNEPWHGWRYLRIAPDGKLYVAVGVPCNVCDPNFPFGTILRMNTDGTNVELFAGGVRNSVGMDFHPQTGDVWFTDNGRDSLGDRVPPDELNVAPTAGLHFGFPYCHGGFLVDADFGTTAGCAGYVAPALNLPAHVAALGMRFYTGTLFPEEYQGAIFIAEHGSWDSSVPVGARVTWVRFPADGGDPQYAVFADGWQAADGARWGRPVDLLVMPDGALLVSDDLAGAVYRIGYDGAG